MQRAIRLRSLNGEPFSYLVTYIPQAIASRYTVAQMAETPLLALLEQVGAEVSEAEQWISAVSAEPDHGGGARRADILPLAPHRTGDARTRPASRFSWSMPITGLTGSSTTSRPPRRQGKAAAWRAQF